MPPPFSFSCRFSVRRVPSRAHAQQAAPARQFQPRRRCTMARTTSIPLLGNFNFQLHFMLHPLTSTPDWTDMAGTGACYEVWNGQAQLDTIELDSASGGHMEGLTLRLYDRDSRQWRLYWANNRIGRLDPPQIGDFRDGHGDFYTTDTINGKTTLIRFDWSRMTSSAPHFEQAFSPDGGQSWEVNWITNQTRTGDAVWGQPAAWTPQHAASRCRGSQTIGRKIGPA